MKEIAGGVIDNVISARYELDNKLQKVGFVLMVQISSEGLLDNFLIVPIIYDRVPRS